MSNITTTDSGLGLKRVYENGKEIGKAVCMGSYEYWRVTLNEFPNEVSWALHVREIPKSVERIRERASIRCSKCEFSAQSKDETGKRTITRCTLSQVGQLPPEMADKETLFEYMSDEYALGCLVFSPKGK